MPHRSPAQKGSPDRRQLVCAAPSTAIVPEPLAGVTDPGQQPLELILARNLVSIISLAAFLVDVKGDIVFYNDAASAIIGSPFEETGTITREQWNARLQPSDEHGAPLPADELPLAVAVREGRPVYARFRIGRASSPREIEAGALPLVGPAGPHGAIAVFWVPPEDGQGLG
jgi:PAS domain-containing protein